jgi:hypothetical protein
MKKAQALMAIILIAPAFSLSVNAQLFKTLQSLAKAKSTQAANAKDSSALVKPQYDKLQYMTGVDSAKLAGMKSTNQRPSVSPEDSAAAINSFMTASGGNGVVYQYFGTTSTKKSGIMKDTMSMYGTISGNSRVEMSSNMIFISHGVQSGHKYSIALYPNYKTYTLNIFDTSSSVTSDRSTYQVVKIGNEAAGGYNCIHSKLTINNGKTSVTEDVWTSTEVPGYSLYKKMMDQQKNVTPKMMQAMEQAGCMGFFVKMEMQNPNFSMTMLLANVAQKNLPASLFEIPPGYTHASGNNLMYQMMQGANK